MTQLTLRPMTSDELDSYLDRMPNGYAQQRMEFGGEDRETAERQAFER